MGEAGGAVAGLDDGVDERADVDDVGVIEDGSLAGEEIDFDLMDAGIGLQGFTDGLLAAVAVHAFDFDEDELIAVDVVRHEADSDETCQNDWTAYEKGEGATTGFAGVRLIALRSERR